MTKLHRMFRATHNYERGTLCWLVEGDGDVMKWVPDANTITMISDIPSEIFVFKDCVVSESDDGKEIVIGDAVWEISSEMPVTADSVVVSVVSVKNAPQS